MNNLDKENLEWIDEVYEIYKKEVERLRREGKRVKVILIQLLTKEEFFNKIKTDSEFVNKFGIKVETRELSLEERHKLALPIWKEKYGHLADMMVLTNVDNTPYKIPRRAISLTYNDKIIEIYEKKKKKNVQVCGKAIIDPLGTIIKGESFSMNVVNDENCMRRERLILYIGECIYRIDNKGFIIERLIPHE